MKFVIIPGAQLSMEVMKNALFFTPVSRFWKFFFKNKAENLRLSVLKKFFLILGFYWFFYWFFKKVHFFDAKMKFDPSFFFFRFGFSVVENLCLKKKIVKKCQFWGFFWWFMILRVFKKTFFLVGIFFSNHFHSIPLEIRRLNDIRFIL